MASLEPSEFGTMVKERRRDLGLTQEGLAERAGISARTIADLERGIIRAPRRDTLDLLVEALELDSEEREDWYALRQRKSIPNHSIGLTSHLPVPADELIGRDEEIQSLCDLLSRGEYRLITVTGPGGVGKTRIALAVGQQLRDQFRYGVQYVELTTVHQPELLISTVARHLGIRDGDPEVLRARLMTFLAQRSMLLILDNAEHLREAAADIAELLTSCSALHLLVTSRAGLRIRAEYEFPIHPLALPGRESWSTAAAIQAYPAIQLFVRRARHVRPDFTLTKENSEAVSRICSYLDGLPLAIELAAARVKVLPPSRIVPRLIDRLGFLTEGMLDAPDRHQTMRAAIDWSYNLLAPEEKRYFRRLSAFVGGWTLEAAEAVAPDEFDAVDGLSRLLNHSLIHQSGLSEDDVRFSMLETVREFGLEELQKADERDTVMQLHSNFYLSFAESAAPGILGPQQAEWLRRLDVDLANVRVALEFLDREDTQPDPLLRMTAALTWFWEVRGYATEGREWLKRSLAGESGSPANRMRTLAGAGWFAHIQQDSEEAINCLEDALALARELEQHWWESWILHLLGRVAYFDADPDTADFYAGESLYIAKSLEDRWLEAWAEHLFGLAAFIRDDLTASRRHHERSLEIREVIGYPEGICLNTGLIGVVLMRQGDRAGAYRLFRKGLQVGREIGARWLIINWIANIVLIAAEEHQPQLAARLAGFVESMSGMTGAFPIPINEVSLQRGIDLSRAALGDEVFDQLSLDGQRITIERAISEASAIMD